MSVLWCRVSLIGKTTNLPAPSQKHIDVPSLQTYAKDTNLSCSVIAAQEVLGHK